jgi:hypothetical protein
MDEQYAVDTARGCSGTLTASVKLQEKSEAESIRPINEGYQMC